MSSAAAKVIIDAEDLASKKIADAARNVERNIKSIKDVGGKAKASTEFIGTLANSLGGSQLSGFAGELGQLTERISAFSEVSKAGGAGAMAFKAGLVGVVGVLSYKVGEALGSAVFETKRWRLEIEAATEAARKLSSEVERSAGKRFGKEMASIDMLGDPEAQKKATQELLAQLDKDIEGKAKALESYRKKVMEVELQWMPLTTLGKTIHEQNKLQVQEAERLRDVFKEQAQELREKIVADEQALRLKEKERAEAERIQQQKEAAAKVAAEEKRIADEAAKAQAKQAAEAERISNIRQREIDRLKEQRILLEQGAEAAKAFALEQQGLDKATAQRLAAEGAAIEEQRKKIAEDGKGGASSQQIGSQAVQSRLLTHGPAEKGIDKIAKESEAQTRLLGELKAIAEQNKRETMQLELVS